MPSLFITKKFVSLFTQFIQQPAADGISHLKAAFQGRMQCVIVTEYTIFAPGVDRIASLRITCIRIDSLMQRNQSDFFQMVLLFLLNVFVEELEYQSFESF